jgi:hypothetical protein
VADTLGQTLRRYKYLNNDSRVLELQQTIPTDGGIDNIEYDSLSNKIFGASLYRLKDAIKVHSVHYGLVPQRLREHPHR